MFLLKNNARIRDEMKHWNKKNKSSLEWVMIITSFFFRFSSLIQIKCLTDDLRVVFLYYSARFTWADEKVLPAPIFNSLVCHLRYKGFALCSIHLMSIRLLFSIITASHKHSFHIITSFYSKLNSLLLSFFRTFSESHSVHMQKCT